ncbi:hypothetical protein GGS20DRAFT_244877 [Poronia punctata]|nr:hypothetical protein GGS20DRAFT_244877 [Poronia punctata]
MSSVGNNHSHSAPDGNNNDDTILLPRVYQMPTAINTQRTMQDITPPGSPDSATTFNTDATTVANSTTPITPFSRGNMTPGAQMTPSIYGSPAVFVQGMPYTPERLMEMGEALAQARRERNFPPTTTPNYNVQATIDDYEDLQRLQAAREGQGDSRDDAFRSHISRMYIQIQRRIQDRDLTQSNVAAEANVRARLDGMANGTNAEAGIYNLMRHAVNSVLRLNNLSQDSDVNIVEAASARVINAIRSNVQGQASSGLNGVNEANMDAVVEEVFSAIENALGDQVNSQRAITDAQRAQLESMNNVTTAQNLQVNAIAGHVSAIDNHVHAMGNNVNAMGSLLNSTNGNVTTLTTNIGTLQMVVNMLPQMVVQSVREMIPGIVGPAIEQALGPAIEQAFSNAISNELIARMQTFAIAMQRLREQGGMTHKGFPLENPTIRSTSASSANNNNEKGTDKNTNQPQKKKAKKSNGNWYSSMNIFRKRPDRRDPPCPPPCC